MWCRVLLCVQRNFLLRFRLEMTDDTSLLQYPFIPGSLVACRSTAPASARLILSSVRTQTSRLSTRLQFSSDMLRCGIGVVITGTGTPFTESPLIEICSAKVRPRYFALHQHFTWVSGHHLYGSLRSDLNVERVVTAVWGSGDCSHSEYSIGVPSFRLTNSRDIRSTFFDRRALFGDNQCFR